MPSFKKIIHHLIEKNISLSLAESCTGGLLSSYFTEIQGVSQIFDMGLVTYSNNSKNTILDIPLSTIKKHGAVSKKVANLMSKNLSIISGSKICVSTTGIAGPSGGSKSKPVGLVYIGITVNKKTIVFKKKFNGSRKKIQKEIALFCLNTLYKLT